MRLRTPSLLLMSLLLSQEGGAGHRQTQGQVSGILQGGFDRAMILMIVIVMNAHTTTSQVSS